MIVILMQDYLRLVADILLFTKITNLKNLSLRSFCKQCSNENLLLRVCGHLIHALVSALTRFQIQTAMFPFQFEAMARVAVPFGSSRSDAGVVDALTNVSSNPTLSKAHEISPQTFMNQIEQHSPVRRSKQ